MALLDLLIQRIKNLDEQSNHELPIEWVKVATPLAALEEKRQQVTASILDEDIEEESE